MAAHGSGRRTDLDGRLPVISTARAPGERPHMVGSATVAMSSVVGDSVERREEATRRRDPSRQPQEDPEMILRVAERLRAEHREDTHKLLAQLREDAHKKDEMVAKLLEQHREDLRRKDEQLAKKDEQLLAALAKKDEQHREDLREQLAKKDEQLERLMKHPAGGDVPLTFHAPVPKQSQIASTMPPAAPLAPPPAAPSPLQARHTPPDGTGQGQPPAVVTSAPVPTDDWVALLQAGGDEAEAALSNVLESALETLEAVLMLTPRKQRKSVKAQCERAEAMLEELNGEVVGRLVSCAANELRVLGEKLGSVQALRATGDTDIGCLDLMIGALDDLEKCSNVITGSSRQLAAAQPAVRRLGLEALSALPRTVLEQSVAAEVEAASLVLSVAVDEGKADEERVTALLSLFVLSLRNAGATVDVLVKYLATDVDAEVYDGRVHGREGAAMCANAGACFYIISEITLKCGAAVRGPLEKAAMVNVMNLVKGSCPKARYQELLPLYLEATESDDAVVASAACSAIANPLLTRTGKECFGTFFSCDPARVGWDMWKRLIEPRAPATRWRPLAQELSVESACLFSVGIFLMKVGGFTSAVKGGISHDGAWPELVAEAVHLMQVNCEAKLSAQDSFSLHEFFWAAALVSYAAQDSAHHPAVLPCAEALLWTAAHGSFPFLGGDIADFAAQACVRLLGRNEGGLTLDKGTVDAVLNSVHTYFDTSPTANWLVKKNSREPARKVASKVQLVTDMAIADANKPFVLQHPHALDDLLTALLLDEDNPRRSLDGADKLQAVAAHALENLALSEAGKAVLRAHTGVMAGLRTVLPCDTAAGQKRLETNDSHRAQRPSAADVGIDQIRNKKLQIHACARIKGYQCLR